MDVLRRWRAVALSAAVVVSGCSLAVGLDPLDDGTCVEGLKVCDEMCVPTDDRRYGCASPRCTPCFLDNATEICGPLGECAIATCDRGFADCDERRENGCEADVEHDVTHCGRCDRRCALANAEPLCTAGRCVIGLCDTSFADCDERPDNGCESDLRSDVEHCGDCDTECEDGQRCVARRCVD